MNSKIKIGLIGNMNNMLFQQQRYYEDWGYDTTLFLLEEYSHFLPEADVFFDPYQKYKIMHLGWNIETFYSISKKTIYDLFSQFDILIGTDLAPAYLYKAGLKLDIFCLHGSDVFEYPFYRFKKNKPSLWETNQCHFSLCQFEGIKLAKYLAFNKAAELYEKPISIIRKRDKRISSYPYIYIPQFTVDYFDQSNIKDQIIKLRSEFGFIILHHCSHNWFSQKNNLYTKGNDKVITAFSDYIKQSKANKKACLVLLEYGPDVSQSKKMINDLGIANYVYWLPKQQRKNLISCVNMSDIGIGELSNEGWLTYSVIVEFILMNKPVIHYRNSKLYANDYPDLYPMVDTNQPEVVTQTLIDYENNPEKYKEMGESAKAWYLHQIHNKSLNDFNEKIKERSSIKKDITFVDYIFHSNKIDLLMVFYWKLYNILIIKLHLQNV